jgi:hypothetical protein
LARAYLLAKKFLAGAPSAKVLLADKGYDADGFREVLADRNDEACLPAKSNRQTQMRLPFKKIGLPRPNWPNQQCFRQE